MGHKINLMIVNSIKKINGNKIEDVREYRSAWRTVRVNSVL